MISHLYKMTDRKRTGGKHTRVLTVIIAVWWGYGGGYFALLHVKMHSKLLLKDLKIGNESDGEERGKD